MGRLIDASVLQEEYKKRHDGKRLLLIDVAPTVDAVPVSWIMAQVEERKARGTAFDMSVASILRTMMKEWKDGQTD